jgi:hypothetical protein
MVTYHLHHDNPDVSPITGHHTIEVCVHEHHDDGSIVMGVMEKYGISLAEIDQRFNGSVDKWLAWVGREMLAKHKSHQGVHTELLMKRGTKVEIKGVDTDDGPLLQPIPQR